MKKTALITLLVLGSFNLIAQIETNVKLGSSVLSASGTTIPSSGGFYFHIGGGYRFFNNDHITLIPKLFFEKSAFTIENLTFGGMVNNGVFTFEETTINYRLYSVGLDVNTEIKVLNLDKKVNFYISPNISVRKILRYQSIPSNSNIGEPRSGSGSDIAPNLLFDWGIELGAKLKKFKFALFLKDVINKGNRSNSGFSTTNGFGVSVSYLFGGGKSPKVKEEE